MTSSINSRVTTDTPTKIVPILLSVDIFQCLINWVGTRTDRLAPGRMEVWNTAIQTQSPITVSLKGSFLEKHLSIQNLEGKSHWRTKRNLARLEALLFILSCLCRFLCHLVVYAPMKQSFMTSRTLALMIKNLANWTCVLRDFALHMIAARWSSDFG